MPGARRSGTRIAVRLVVIAAALACAPALPARATGPDVVDLALGFARGGYRSPVICTFSGTVHQGLRRVLIVPGPPQSERRVDRITFYDLDAHDAQRCRHPLGGDAPNIVGSLLIGFNARRPNSDTPERDFKEELREGPLQFDIVSGQLRIGEAEAPVESLPEVSFEGGHAELRPVRPNSDVDRILVDFPPARRLWLAIESPDGRRIEMPLVEFERR